jgi:hypothetical protein
MAHVLQLLTAANGLALALALGSFLLLMTCVHAHVRRPRSRVLRHATVKMRNHHIFEGTLDLDEFNLAYHNQSLLPLGLDDGKIIYINARQVSYLKASAPLAGSASNFH